MRLRVLTKNLWSTQGEGVPPEPHLSVESASLLNHKEGLIRRGMVHEGRIKVVFAFPKDIDCRLDQGHLHEAVNFRLNEQVEKGATPQVFHLHILEHHERGQLGDFSCLYNGRFERLVIILDPSVEAGEVIEDLQGDSIDGEDDHQHVCVADCKVVPWTRFHFLKKVFKGLQ